MAGVTMSAIAATAGVARQTLYNHFPDVDSVVYEAVSAHQKESVATLALVLGTINSPTGQLEHLVRHSAALAAAGHPAPRLMFSAEVAAMVADHDRQMNQLIATTLQEGVDNGEFRRDLDVQKDAVLVQRMIEAVGEVVNPGSDDVKAMVAGAVRTVLGSVQA